MPSPTQTTSEAGAPDNARVADALDRIGELLSAQGASPFRARAYRAAAQTVRELPARVAELLAAEGPEGLERLPHIGPSIARTIARFVRSGRLGMLDRLQGELGPEQLFATIPGIGPSLAHAVHECLGIHTLEELELAAHDGRLATVAGFGPRRVRAVRELLASLLRRTRFERPPHTLPAPHRPEVSELLAIDARYRAQAERGQLAKIAPRRFNPEHEAWLPVLHAELGEHHYTALFSNTALAHKLGTTHDWVVIFYDGTQADGQCTVVTERKGALAGRRVVRGREGECARYYREHAGEDPGTLPPRSP